MKGVRIKAPAFVDCLPYLDAIAAKVDHNKPETLWRALSQYIDFCSKTGMIIGNNSCYYACGISKETAAAWYRGTRRGNNPEYHRFAEMLKTICAAAREQYGLEGVVNPILTIFHQKHFDGFTDTPQIMDIRHPLGDLPDAEKLIKKYGGLYSDAD